MKNTITLNNETIEELKTLYNNIDGESGKSCNDYNLDLVTESQFRILDIVKDIVFQNDVRYQLRKLLDEIDNEESKDDYEDMNVDLVTENTYKILDIVRKHV